MRILFLCSELAGYFANTILLLQKTHQPEIRVVSWPNSNHSPFEHDLPEIKWTDRFANKNAILIGECLAYKPDLIYVSGWMDKTYKQIARCARKKGAVVVGGLDNPWRGTLRQRIACVLSPFLIRPYYDKLWVAGHRQYQFARRLGYNYNDILSGLYAANVDAFSSIAQLPHRKELVFVGRFEPIKGVELLYEVFSSLSSEQRQGWKLQMIGNGSLRDKLKSSECIFIHSFMQPEELVSFTAFAGGFILPSVTEPWGVVVHEFAAAGKPLILSTEVNSGEAFLVHGFNGFRFKADDREDLRKTLIRFFALSEEARKTMGTNSRELAMRGDPKFWVANFLSSVHT